MLQYIDTLSRLSALFPRKQLLRECHENRCCQNLSNLIVTYCEGLVTSSINLARWRATAALKMNSFTDDLKS